MSIHTAGMVKAGSSILAGTGKRGILTPDAEGYYTIPLGMYGTTNSAGMFYDGPSGVSMFKADTPLMRRLNKQVLFMEWKHPEPWENVVVQGQAAKRYLNDNEYLMRIRKIDDDRVCAHIKNLFLDHNAVDAQGRKAVMVYGVVKPYGPFGKYFKESLDNPNINTYASVRSITRDDVLRGVKYTCEISTWDAVGEGGILHASKYHAAALEDFDHTETDNGIVITPETLRKVEADGLVRRHQGLENAEQYDVSDLRNMLGWNSVAAVRKPRFLR